MLHGLARSGLRNNTHRGLERHHQALLVSLLSVTAEEMCQSLRTAPVAPGRTCIPRLDAFVQFVCTGANIGRPRPYSPGSVPWQVRKVEDAECNQHDKVVRKRNGDQPIENPPAVNVARSRPAQFPSRWFWPTLGRRHPFPAHTLFPAPSHLKCCSRIAR